MNIVIKKSDDSVVVVSDGPVGQYSPDDYDIHILPEWDWSKANLSGVDTNRPDWIQQMMWNGTTLVKNPDWVEPTWPPA